MLFFNRLRKYIFHAHTHMMPWLLLYSTPSQSVNSRKHRILMSAHVVLSDLFTAHPTGSGTIAMCCCGSVTRAWHPPTAIVTNNNQPANRCNGKLRQLARHLACTARRQHQSLCDTTVPLFTSGYIHRASALQSEWHRWRGRERKKSTIQTRPSCAAAAAYIQVLLAPESSNCVT